MWQWPNDTFEYGYSYDFNVFNVSVTVIYGIVMNEFRGWHWRWKVEENQSMYDLWGKRKGVEREVEKVEVEKVEEVEEEGEVGEGEEREGEAGDE